jgi:hypothetical protein
MSSKETDKKNMVDIISCECLDAEHWRIKYKISTIVFDDIFKRVTRLGTEKQWLHPKQTRLMSMLPANDMQVTFVIMIALTELLVALASISFHERKSTPVLLR